MDLKIIDVNFFTTETIASYLIETGEGPILIETGPDTSFENLKNGLSDLGYTPSDVKHVFVTHIHLDHSGAAWRFAAAGSTIYVHPVGAPHLVAPEKLMKSAARIYGDKMEELWGAVRGMDQSSVIALEDAQSVSIGGVEVKAVETTGHAGHHYSYLVENALFTGDTAGCVMAGGPMIPATPPPEIHLEKWHASIDRMREISPDVIYLTHFGGYTDVNARLDAAAERLEEWSEWVGERVSAGKSDEDITEEFGACFREIFEREGVSEEIYRKYDLMAPYHMNAGGLIRYWKKYRLSDS